MIDECIHGLGPVSACTICNGREAKAQREKWNRTATPFFARYDGECARCDDSIRVADLIVSTNGGYVHIRCET